MILPIIKRETGDCVICVRQYRPPLKTYSIEFPAGDFKSLKQSFKANVPTSFNVLKTEMKIHECSHFL